MSPSPQPWPVLRSYSGEKLRRIAMPLGGIGTGNVALGGRGDLKQWEIMNAPSRLFRPAISFFAIRTKDAAGTVVARAVEGPIDTTEYEGAFGSPASAAGLPRFRSCRFDAAYPFAAVHLDDPAVPVSVRLEAFNPFIPTDAEASGYPVAVLRYVCTNTTDSDVEVTLCGSLDNVTGPGGLPTAVHNRHVDLSAATNTVRETTSLYGVFLASPEWEGTAATAGTMALALIDPAAPSTRTSWPDLSWGDSLLNFWEDLSEDGMIANVAGGAQLPVASVADKVLLPANSAHAFTFVLAWHFPNRRAWIGEINEGIDSGRLSDDIIGNHYTTTWSDAWAAAEDFVANASDLEVRTLDFVTEFCASDLPDVVKEAALFNLSTLRTETCFRTADGRFFGWEGIGDTAGSCFGSCTHVWNYEQATAFLFGSLARSMRDTEFTYATDDQGLMSFRVGLPLDKRAKNWSVAAADGQMGCLVKLYRDWRLSGDDTMLKKLWPTARSTLEFAWLPGGWDADRDGVMEGVQHNTMDVEYYGPNPQMGGWYLAALRSVEEMARHLGEAEFAGECHRLFESGSAWMDENLFNGRYYQQQIRPVTSLDDIHPGIRHPTLGAADLQHPELQLGEGCLVDQLVGQTLAHGAGLGHLLDQGNVLTALLAVKEFNGRADLYDHFNHMRTFALADESALLMAAYPEEAVRPTRPFPYFNEVMTGFEYTAAVGLAYEGQFSEAQDIIANIRARYDGSRRNPFDEAECGRHYARAMASWGAVLAWSGFDYDARNSTIAFRATVEPFRCLWSSGDAWGMWTNDGDTATVKVHQGAIVISTIRVGDLVRPVEGLRRLTAGHSVSVRLLPKS